MKKIFTPTLCLILLFSLAACADDASATAPQFQYDGEALPTYAIMINSESGGNSDDGLGSEYTPAELIPMYLASIPMTEIGAGELICTVDTSNTAGYEMEFMGVYTEAGEKLDYRSFELSELPGGRYILCLRSGIRDKIKNSYESNYLFAGIIKGDGSASEQTTTEAETETETETETEPLPPTAMPTHPELQYGSPVITSGDYSINPIASLDSIVEYENGEPALHGDGLGWYIFEAKNIDHSYIPHIVLGGEVELKGDSNEGSTLSESVSVRDTSFKELYKSSFSELHTLPEGEYIIIFDGRYDSRKGDESMQDYSIRHTLYIFKLIVPELQS